MLNEVNSEMITQDVKDFARELGELCTKHGLSQFSGDFHPNWQSKFRGKVQFGWNSGRHGTAAGMIRVQSTVEVAVACPIKTKESKVE